MEIDLGLRLPVRAQNAGLCISRGRGSHPRRTIDSHELIYVTEGTLGVREADSHFMVRAGETLTLRPRLLHEGTSPYPPDLVFYWIHFDINQTIVRGGEVIALPQHTTASRPDRLTQLFRWFLNDQESVSTYAASSSLLLTFMLMEIVDSPIVERSISEQAAYVADKVRQHIKTHFHESLSVSSVAEDLGYSPDYLGRIFREAYGQTITDGIHYFRHRYARRLLMESSMRIEEIAYASGYETTMYFRRIFKRYEGIAPSAFRHEYARAHVNTE